MPQSSPRSVGREVHQDAIAVANVGPAHDAEGRYLGTLGTQTGPPQARHARVEGAWADRSPAHVRRHLPRRREKLPHAGHESRWKAPGRRCKRYRQRNARGKHAHPVVVASARERIAFLWAIAQEGPVTH